MKYCPVCEKSYEDRFVACELDGATLRSSGPQQDSLIGTVVKGRYRVLKKLGEGGMGAVYLADQFSINRKVALKILHPNYARDEEFVRRFRQEAMLAASFSHHNAITVYDFDQADDGRLYIVMEYVDGHNLSAFIKDRPMDIGKALRLAIQIAEGLSAAHRAGIIHRDIKPENIMVVEGGEDVKLMDFGIARLRDSAAATRLTQPGMIMGTPSYMAPEQIEGGEISERTDIYAFGIVLYQLLTNRVPFAATTPSAILLQQLKDIPLPVSRLRSQVPKSVERIVGRALEKNPKNRFARMDEVVEVLKKAQQDSEQPDRSKVSEPTQSMAAVRRSFAAVATPFKRLFGKRSVERDAEKPRALRADHASTTLGGHETPAPEVIGQRRPAVRQLSGGQTATETTASAPAASPAQTVALTQPLQTSERAVQQTQLIDEAARNARPGFESPAERSELDRRDDAAGRTELFDRQFQPAEQPTAAVDIGATPSWQPDDTPAETAMVTRPVEKVTIRKQSWIVAATASLILVLAGAIGVTVYRNLPVEKTQDAAVVKPAGQNPGITEGIGSPPIPVAEQGELAAKERDRISSPAQTLPVNVGRPRSEPERRDAPPVITAPDERTRERPRAKTPAPIKIDTPSIKPDKKTPFPLETVTVKKPDTVVYPEIKPGERASIAAPDREQKTFQKPVTDPEKADSGTTKMASLKSPPPTSKKSPEPSAGQETASLRQPEAPTPLPRVDLKDLSIIAKKRELSVEERVVLGVKGKYSDGNEVDIKAGVQWKSSDPSVASVNSRGEILALKEGTTQISATYQGVLSGNYTFNVKAGEETRKPDSSGEQIKDLRRRLLR